MATSNNASSTVSATSTTTTNQTTMNTYILSTVVDTIVTSLGNAFPPARKLTTRSARRLAALIAFRAYGGDKFVKALATTATADHTSRVMIEAATIAATCVTSAAQEVLSAMARATRTDTAVLMGLMPLMARALRPVTTTRAARKAAARKAMAKASRKANRARKSVSRRTPRVVVIRSPQPISRNRGFVGIARRTTRTRTHVGIARRTTRTRTHVGIARRTTKVQASISVPTHRMLEVVAAMRRANRLARIAAKGARRAARNAQKVITVGVGRTYTVPAPVLVDKVHTCAVPSPVLLDKTVQVESAPLATQRPEVVSYRRPTRKALVTTAIEVEPVVAAIDKAVKVLSLAEKEAARDARAAYKEAYSEWQAACIAAKAAYKKANPHASSKDKGANPKGKKNNGGGGNRKREQYTPPQRPEILSQRADLNIKAGPTDSNDYGWTPMSEMELASFFYGEEVDGVAIADMGLSEVPTPMTSVPSRGDNNDLYNMVINMSTMPPRKTAEVTTGTLTSAYAPAISNPQDMIVTDGGKKARVFPAEKLTELMFPLPKGWFDYETVIVNYARPVGKKGGQLFVGQGATIEVLQNTGLEGTRGAGDLFITNSYVRYFTKNADLDTKDKGTEYVFAHWMQIVMNATVESSNEAAFALLAKHSETIAKGLKKGVVTSVEGYFADLMIDYTAPTHYIVMVTVPVKDEKGNFVLDNNGKVKYEYDVEELEREKLEWEAQGYKVIGIKPVLKMPKLSAMNFRIDGEVPCKALTKKEINDQEITSWTMDNYHRAVKPVSDSDIGEWFANMIASKTIKSMSISFNGITFPESIKNDYKGGVEHQYQFTTGSDKYAAAGVKTSVPAFVINLWTTEVIAEAAVPSDVSRDAGDKTAVHKGKGGKFILDALTAVMEKNKKGTPANPPVSKVGTSTNMPIGLAAQTAAAKAREAELAQAQAAAAAKAREAELAQAQAQAAAEAKAREAELALAAAEAQLQEVEVEVDDFDMEAFELAMSEFFVPTTSIMEPTEVNKDTVVTPEVGSVYGFYGEEALPATPVEEITPDAANVSDATKAAEEAANKAAASLGNPTGTGLGDWDDEDEEGPDFSNMDELIKKAPEEASKCGQVALTDIAMPDDYVTGLEAVCANLGINVYGIMGDTDLGYYKDGEVYVGYLLGDNHRAQVMLHELFHYACDQMDEATAEAMIANWLDSVGPSVYTPVGASLEEQAAYSFMGYAHDLVALEGFLMNAGNGDAWGDYYYAMQDAITATGTVVDKAPIAIVKDDAMPVATNHVSDALSSIGAGADTQGTGRQLLVLCAPSGKVPDMYKEALPGLQVPKLQIGDYYTTVINGVTIHALCGANEEGDVLYPNQLRQALTAIVNEQGPKQTYVCEEDLGFKDNIATTSVILGHIRNIVGKRAKIITLRSMKTAIKQWGTVGYQPVYPKADLDIIMRAALTPGTELKLVPMGSHADGSLVDGVDHGHGKVAMTVTFAVLDADNKVDADSLAEAIATLETYIVANAIPMPIYVYSCQKDAFTTLSCKVEVVEYEEGALLPNIKVEILKESPRKGELIGDWYTDLIGSLDSKKAGKDGLNRVMELSQELYADTFKVLGYPEHLAGFALSPIPYSWSRKGIVLVVPGVGANGLIDKAVEYEELIDKALLQAFLDLGIKVYTAEWVYSKAAKKYVFKGKNTLVHREMGCYPLPDGDEGDIMLELKDNECEFVNGNVIGININHKAVKSLPQYMQKHVLDTVQYLIDTKGVGVAINYMEAALPKFVKKADESRAGKLSLHLGVKAKAKAAEYRMEFTIQDGKNETDWDYLSPKHCAIHSTSKDMEVNKITNLSGFPDTLYDGVTVAIGLAISAGSGREMTQNVWEGYLASTTNLWARQDNYGLKLITENTDAGWSISDVLRVIINNSGKTISATANQNMNARGVALGREEGARWPYHMPCNASLDLSMMEVLMKKGELVVCDKYAMDRIIIGDGARALLASVLTPEQAEKLKGYDEEYGIEIALDPVNGRVIYTVCWPTDKASKALNRPSQFWGTTQADGWLEALTWSKLTTKLSDGKRAGVRGTKVQVIATNDFLSQGSGEASMFSKEARRITYKVDGTMRFTLNWTVVPTVQQNQYPEGHPKAGQHKPGFAKQVLQGPAQNEGPDGKDRDGKVVPVTKWFCDSFKKAIVIPAIEAAMKGPKGEYRIYEPGEVMVEILKEIRDANGNIVPGYYPDGTTPGLPASKLVMFSNDLNQKVIITGYRFQSLANGEDLQVILSYATVSDSMADNWSGAKLRGLGIKAILGYDGTIRYYGTAPLNGVETDLNELYRNGAIHFTPEGLKGNYAFMQGFAAAHGSAHMSGPYLIIDDVLMDGTPNDYYIPGSADMVSDMTDTNSYFYRWVRENTRTIRMRKTLSQVAWEKIVQYNADDNDSTDLATIMPGLVIISKDDDAATAWDISKKDALELKHSIEATPSITVEYDVQVLVFDYWIQIEVADPGACTGVQGMTAEQLANLALVEFHTAEELWRRGEASRDGVRLAVESARTHAEIEAGLPVEGVFAFNPMEASHNALMRQLQYIKSDTGVYTARPAKDFFILLATLFGGAGTDTAGLWKGLLEGTVTHIDYIDGKIIFANDGYSYLDEENGGVKGLREYLTNLSGVDDEGNVEIYVPGKGLMIKTQSGNDGGGEVTTATTYIDPTVFLQLGAFESVLVAADPKKNEPSKRVTGAATGIVNDIYKAFQQWGTAQFWLRKSVTGAIHGKNSLLRNSMLGWIGVNSKENTMMNAKGVLSRVARVGNYACIAGKIRNGIGMEFEPHRIFNTDGTITRVPVAVLHPDCLLAKGLRHGDVIGVGRTPMVSLAFCVVKFSRHYGTIGYIGMSFYDWAGGNNGDTDGDPCSRTVVGVYRKGEWHGVTPLRAAKMNQHVLSMGGYSIVCGKKLKDHDCAEFVSFKIAWSKKAINSDLIPTAIAEWAATNGIKIKPLEALVNFMLPSMLLDSAEKVSGHYGTNVGIAYGWCSAYSAHMKEKHSYMEKVVSNLLQGYYAQSFDFGWQYDLPSVQEMMEVLISGEIYDSMGIVPAVVEEIHFSNNSQDYFFFSNMHSEFIEYKGITYMCVEAAYQAQKDPTNALMFSKMNGFMAREAGRNVANLRPDWDQVKDGIMEELLAIKFSNPLMMSDLVNTGHAVLVHKAPWDLYWGTNDVEGENMLGKMLMALRNTPPAVVEKPTISDEMRAKYPAIVALCEYKATPGNTTLPCDLIQMGQHIKVMLEASAWLWRGIYEGLGLSGYSPKAYAFFECFTIALRNNGKVADASIKDKDGKVIWIQPAYPAKGSTDDSADTTDVTDQDDDTDTTAPSSVVHISEFLSKHYHMSLDVANEIYAASLLYNGYRAIERGQHIPGDDAKVPTTYEVYKKLYANTMAQWDDTQANEFVNHSILAGVFRRAGQGTTGVSIDEELSPASAAEMIYRYAEKQWIMQLTPPANLPEGVVHKPKIFFNPMLNDIVVKSVNLYTELVEISQISNR